MAEDVGTFLIKFKKGAPQNKKYRIEVALPCVTTPDKTYYDALPPEQIALYAESGWDLITYSDGFYIFAAEDEDSIPELHTDPELQAETLAALDKSLRKAAIVQLLRLPNTAGILLFSDTTRASAHKSRAEALLWYRWSDLNRHAVASGGF